MSLPAQFSGAPILCIPYTAHVSDVRHILQNALSKLSSFAQMKNASNFENLRTSFISSPFALQNIWCALSTFEVYFLLHSFSDISYVLLFLFSSLYCSSFLLKYLLKFQTFLSFFLFRTYSLQIGHFFLRAGSSAQLNLKLPIPEVLQDTLLKLVLLDHEKESLLELLFISFPFFWLMFWSWFSAIQSMVKSSVDLSWFSSEIPFAVHIFWR